MSVEKLQGNFPLVDQNGHMTPTTQEVLEKLVDEIIALQARVAALEP